MNLRDLDPKLVRLAVDDEDGATYLKRVDTLPEAHAVKFLCPGCFAAAGGSQGVHVITIYFSGRTAQDGWRMSGSGLDDLTLSPSIYMQRGCGWHGFVRNGAIETC